MVPLQCTEASLLVECQDQDDYCWVQGLASTVDLLLPTARDWDYE